MTKKIVFGALTGDLAGETAISILERKGYLTTMLRPLEIEEIIEKNNLDLILFLTKDKKRKKSIFETSDCFFIINCELEEIENKNFHFKVINIAEKFYNKP